MAAASAPQGIIPPVIYNGTYGHTFYYEFRLRNLGERESCTFCEEFRSDCPVKPSRWLCEVAFRKASDDRQVSIPITLKRIDDGFYPLKIRFESYIDDEVTIRNFSFDGPPIILDEVQGGQEVVETVFKDLPSKEERDRFNQKLFVKFFIYVGSCHDGRIL